MNTDDNGVVSLTRRGTAPHADIVETLENLLAEAKRGDIQALVYSCARRDHVRKFGFHNSPGYLHDLAAGALEVHYNVGQLLSAGVDVPDLD